MERGERLRGTHLKDKWYGTQAVPVPTANWGDRHQVKGGRQDVTVDSKS